MSAPRTTLVALITDKVSGSPLASKINRIDVMETF